MNEVLPYVRGFVLGYLALRFVPEPYILALMLCACLILILNGLGVFK